jgi:hypothetical protein
MAGQRIDDMGGMPHTSDMAMKSKTHLKEYHSAEGSGGIREYEDTTQRIRSTQMEGDKQIKKQPMKSGYRY